MAIRLTNCVVCDAEFAGSLNALYCSGKCKQARHRAKMPKSGYIYRLKNKGEVVYVGQTREEEGIENRVRHHRHSSPKKIFDEYDFYKVEGEVLNEAESKEIISFNPMYNKVLPRNTGYKSLKVAAKSLLPVMEELITSLCDTYPLGDEDGKHLSYIKSCDLETLKESILTKLKDINDEQI